MKNLFPFTRNLFGSSKDGLGQKHSEKGVAIMIAVFTTMVIMWLVTEITYDSNVEYVVNANAISKVKAYYAAKSGYELSLLRIKLFDKIQKQLGATVPADKKKMLDLIWNFPFTWPPMVPDGASGVDKDMIKDKVKEAAMDATYYATISDEGSKIDINDLGSPVKGLRDLTKKLLLQIFENRMRNDEDWARAHQDIKFEEIINNIADWVDDDQISQNNGDERALYSEINVDNELPPNRGFRTPDELRMVAGMTEEIYNMLKDRVTVYGMRAINPNYASADVLKALDPSMKQELVDKIIARRNDEKRGHFKDDGDFWNFVNAEGGQITAEAQKEIMLTFSQVVNFRIRSVGEYAGVSREIEAVSLDLSEVAGTIAQKIIKDAKAAAGGQASATTGNANNSKVPLPKGPPRIVYFIER